MWRHGKGQPEPRHKGIVGVAAVESSIPLGVSDLPKLKPAEFDEIRHFAKRRFGLDLRKGKEELVSARLARGMRQGRFPSFRAYLDHVEADSSGQALISLINALTTNHTSFYREPHHFEFLANEILTKIRPGSDFSVWSAASSTGEEPYSIGCCVAQQWRGQTRGLRILATDISTKVLDSAKAATYPASSLDPAPAGWRAFFTKQSPSDTTVRVRPEIVNCVSFKRLNLIEPIPFQDRFHVIFCRNVMIYFDKPTQEHVVSQLAAHLHPGGYLFVGHSESLAGVTHALTYVKPAIYRDDAGKGRAIR